MEPDLTDEELVKDKQRKLRNSQLHNFYELLGVVKDLFKLAFNRIVNYT